MKKTIALMITATAFLALASLAYASEVTRETYKAEVEPICQKNTQTTEKTLKGVETEVKKGKLKRPAKQIKKAAQALNATVALLKAVPQPEADQATLTKWLGEVKAEVGLLEGVAKKLKAGNKNAAEKMKIKLDKKVELSNDTVLGFEFHYCKGNTGKFT